MGKALNRTLIKSFRKADALRQEDLAGHGIAMLKLQTELIYFGQGNGEMAEIKATPVIHKLSQDRRKAWGSDSMAS
jgi:hypothetical protein